MVKLNRAMREYNKSKLPSDARSGVKQIWNTRYVEFASNCAGEKKNKLKYVRILEVGQSTHLKIEYLLCLGITKLFEMRNSLL